MHPVAKTRVVTWMTSRQKSELKAKAHKAGISVSDFVRQAVNAYDSEDLQQRRAIGLFRRPEQGSEPASV